MSIPLVSLEGIPAHGLTIAVSGWARDACAVALGGVVRTIEGGLVVCRHGRDIGVTGQIRGGGDVVCDRCGVTIPLDLAVEVSCLYLAPRAEGAEDPETELTDLGEYDGIVLDLALAVQESLVLERPLRVLCTDATPPGSDLECLARWRAAAAPAPPDLDPRFAILQKLKT